MEGGIKNIGVCLTRKPPLNPLSQRRKEKKAGVDMGFRGRRKLGRLNFLKWKENGDSPNRSSLIQEGCCRGRIEETGRDIKNNNNLLY